MEMDQYKSVNVRVLVSNEGTFFYLYITKCIKNVFSKENICTIQKNVVLLHAFSPRTREGD